MQYLYFYICKQVQQVIETEQYQGTKCVCGSMFHSNFAPLILEACTHLTQSVFKLLKL